MRQLLAPLRAVTAVFGNPDLARLTIAWGGIAFSMWAFVIALGVFAYDVGGPAAVGIAALVRLLPGAIASPFAGLLGDRHSRRTILLWSTLGTAAALAGAAAAAAAGAPVGVVFALAGAFTVASSGYLPAESGLLPTVARSPQELAAANVARSSIDSIAFLLASVATGLLLVSTSPQFVFALAAGVAVVTCVALLGVKRDQRPDYIEDGEYAGVARETARGFQTLLGHSGLRLIAATFSLLLFFEGAIDVLGVILVLDQLGLSSGSVGLINACWGVGALIAGVGLALMLDRGKLAAGLVGGVLLIGAATALPGAWAVPAIAFAAWIGIGLGYAVADVAADTLLQRLGDDEVLSRVRGSIETAKLASSAIGSIAAAAAVGLFGTRATLLGLAALLPLFVLVRWSRLRAFEISAPIDERRYTLLRGDPIFEPLPVATVETVSRNLIPVQAASGDPVITQGEAGDRFYLIDAGTVEVFEDEALVRRQGEGESFGEIALLRDVPRTATVRATSATSLFALDREHFIAAVTGHRRSHDTAKGVATDRFGTAAVSSSGPQKDQGRSE